MIVVKGASQNGWIAHGWKKYTFGCPFENAWPTTSIDPRVVMCHISETMSNHALSEFDK